MGFYEFEHYPQFTHEHQMFRKTVKDFCEKELSPHVEAWERDRLFPRWVFKKMGELGFLGTKYPEDIGGAALDYWYTVAFAESLPFCRMAGLTMGVLVQSEMATPVIDAIGTGELRKEFLAPAIAGDMIAALAITEPDVGSDVANLRTVGRRDGDDYIISGAKTYITNGTRADFLTLAVRTGDPGFGGISLFVFPTNTKGYSVSRKLEKLGNHCSDTAELHFDECRIPARYMLGEENLGFIYIMKNFQGERLVGALSAIAGAARVLGETLRYAQTRKAFGKPLSRFQTVSHQFAQLGAELEAARALNYRAADLYDRGLDAVREISMAKLVGGELACRIADRCLQIYGGLGYMAEADISRMWRDTRLITIGGGTSEIMREIISKYTGI